MLATLDIRDRLSNVIKKKNRLVSSVRSYEQRNSITTNLIMMIKVTETVKKETLICHSPT